MSGITPGAVVPMTEVDRAKLADYLAYEITDSLAEHNELEDRLDDWQMAYDGDPKERKKTFPWPGASNVVIPIIGMTCDAIVARFINTLFGMTPFWSARALRRETEPFAKPIENYLEWSRINEFNLYGALRPWANELTKFGWAWLKWGWEVYTVREWAFDETMGATPRDTIVRRPVLYHVCNRDIIKQVGVEDEKQAEWIAHRIRLTDNQLRLRRHDGLYVDVEKIITNKDDATRVHESLKSDRHSPTSPRERLNTVFEVCVDWPWGDDDYPEQMLVTFHLPTKTVMRAVFNPYGHRMYEKTSFILREGKYEGLGIARRLWHLQEEITTIHRQRVDNGTVANTRFYVGKRGMIKDGTMVWPGRVLTVQDPEKDLKAFQLGDVYPSMHQLEMAALAYAERASGVSDYQMGRESSIAGSRATATGTLAVIQEGNRRFDLNVRDMREGLGRVGKRILELNQRFRPRGAAFFVQGEKEGELTEAVLSLPPEFSAAGMAIELTATTATINREIEKQGLIALMGLANQYYQTLGQAAMGLSNPQVPGELKELIVRMTQGGEYLFKRIAQTFDIKDIDRVVPSLIPDGAGGGPGAGAGPPAGGPDRAASNGRVGGGQQLLGPTANGGG